MEAVLTTLVWTVKGWWSATKGLDLSGCSKRLNKLFFCFPKRIDWSRYKAGVSSRINGVHWYYFQPRHWELKLTLKTILTLKLHPPHKNWNALPYCIGRYRAIYGSVNWNKVETPGVGYIGYTAQPQPVRFFRIFSTLPEIDLCYTHFLCAGAWHIKMRRE